MSRNSNGPEADRAAAGSSRGGDGPQHTNINQCDVIDGVLRRHRGTRS
jgi:hypothetical protein